MASSVKENSKEYKFLVELDDELKCLICLEVARDPLQHEECGKLFCKDCLEKYGKSKPCPNCRQENSQYWVDKRNKFHRQILAKREIGNVLLIRSCQPIIHAFFTHKTLITTNTQLCYKNIIQSCSRINPQILSGKRNIDALGVKCYNAERQCPWEGTVATVEEHVTTTCQFTLLSCPNQCKDDKAETNHYIRKELDQHLQHHCPNRHYKCQYCGQDGTYATITNTNHEVCQNKPIPCPNKECKVTVQRGVVADHVERECDYTVLPCKYRSFGCNVKRKRRDMATHEHDDKQQHLDMAMDTTLQLRTDNQTLKSEVSELRRELYSAINILQLTLKSDPQAFKLTGFNGLKKGDEEFEFPPFYTHPHGYHMVFRVDANGYDSGKGTCTSVFIRIVEGDYDADLKWPFLGDVTFTLLNQLEDKNQH